jgi:hypothetical protein
MSNTYNVAGFSTKNGKVSARVANGTAAARAKVLERDGHTSIDLIDLPSPMSKEDAIAFASKAIGVQAPAKAEARPAKVTSAPKAPKSVKVVKTVAQVQEMLTPKRELTAEEQAVKDANLRTMQEVSARLSKMKEVD